MDMQFIAMDLAEKDCLAAVLDTAGMLIPGGTGIGKIGDDAVKFVKNGLDDIGKTSKRLFNIDLQLFAKGKVKGVFSKLSPENLRTIGTKAQNSGIRIVKGTADDAYEFFIKQIDVNTLKEVKSGVFVGKDANGIIFTYRAVSKSGPPIIDVNGIKGLRKIKFIGE